MGLVFGWTFTQKTISKKKTPTSQNPDGFWPKKSQKLHWKNPPKKNTRTLFFPTKKPPKKTLQIFPKENKKNIESNPNRHRSSIIDGNLRIFDAEWKKNKTSSPWVWMVMNPMLTGKKITEKKQMARNYQSPKLAPHICPNQPDVSFFLREIFEWVPPTIPIWRGRGMVQFLRKRAYLFIIALGCSVFPGKRQWLKWKV